MFFVNPRFPDKPAECEVGAQGSVLRFAYAGAGLNQIQGQAQRVSGQNARPDPGPSVADLKSGILGEGPWTHPR